MIGMGGKLSREPTAGGSRRKESNEQTMPSEQSRGFGSFFFKNTKAVLLQFP